MSRRTALVLAAIAALLVVLLGAAAVVTGSLVAWKAGSGPDAHDHAADVPAHAFSAPALAALREAFLATDAARDALAADDLGPVPEQMERARGALEAAAAASDGAPEAVEGYLHRAPDAAAAVGTAPDLQVARERLGALNELLVALAAADPRLAEGWVIYECPMWDGFAKWFQREGPMENPYMGTAMPTCGTETDWTLAGGTAPVAVDPDAVAYWTCPMHPSVQEADFGQCPICHMDLTPVTHAQLESGAVAVDAARRQEYGIKTETLQLRPLAVEVRATGRVTYDERRLTDVSLRVQGWVEDLLVEESGVQVRKGQPLLRLYSPELHAVQQDLLIASRGSGSDLAGEAKRRLLRYGVSEAEIQRMLATGQATDTVTIHSPAGGTIVEKAVVEGQEVGPKDVLFRIADLDAVWVEADVYESDLPWVEVGMPVRIELPYLPGETIEGTVAFLNPVVDPKTRTVPIRVELENPGTALLPNMYADVVLESAVGDRLTVPRAAVIYTGPRRLVFVDEGEGLLVPREITIGRTGGDRYEVLSGLEAGETIVTSGVFLIAAESRLRSASTHWGGHESH